MTSDSEDQDQRRVPGDKDEPSSDPSQEKNETEEPAEELPSLLDTSRAAGLPQRSDRRPSDTVPPGPPDAPPARPPDAPPARPPDTLPPGPPDALPARPSDTVPPGPPDALPVRPLDTLPPGPPDAPFSYRPPPDQMLLNNPYLVAGMAVAGAIVLAVLVVLLFGSSGDDGTNGNVLIDPLTPQPGAGLSTQSIATATVREGPSVEFIEVGTLRAGQEVNVLGRSDDARWFQITFPAGSNLKGWVPSSALSIPDASVNALLVVASTPIPRPTVIPPTATVGPPETATPTPTVTGTATPAGGPDLEASAVSGTCAQGRRLIVSVRNLGPNAIISRAITVLVQTSQGQQRAIATQTATLAVGDVIDIDTGYEVQERVVAVVDPLGTLGDANVNNNWVDCIVTESNAPPVVTPPPFITATPAAAAFG